MLLRKVGNITLLSAYHDPVDGFPVGKHPRISALMAGVHNLRCPQPKYTFIWGVEKVVKFLDSLNILSLSDKMLTLKLTMLLAITSASRAHEICMLDLTYMFQFPQVTKTTKTDKLRLPIKYHSFANKTLCVCEHLDVYIKRSKP